MNVIQAMLDKRVLGFAFHMASWRVWRAILAGAFGLPLSADDAETFRRLTDRDPLTAAVRELWVIAGRRAGKTNIAAAIAIYLATLKRWKVSPGEIATVMVLAADRDQAKVAFRYALGLLQASPVLGGAVDSSTDSVIRLKSGVEIVIATSDKASVRGRTLIAVIADEVSFWGGEAGEVLRAVRPGMATQPNAMLIAISTAYSQRGPLYEAFKRYYGQPDPAVLVVRASTRDLNENVGQEFIDAELVRDPQAAAAEYLAEFRSDLAALLDAGLVDPAVRKEPRELPRIATLRNGATVRAFAAGDISGGRSDATAFAVAWMDEKKRVVIAACRRWPAPHDPMVVAAQVAEFLKGYGLTTAVADQYGAELSRSIYTEAGICLTASPVNRSEAYLHMLPLFTTSRIEIPNEPVLRTELLGLERRVGRTGADSVDHRPGQHDDLANCVALVAHSASSRGLSEGSSVSVIRSSVLAALADEGVASTRYYDSNRPSLTDFLS